MTIIPVKKYLFIGLQKEVDLFFKRAQQKGFLEFISHKEKGCLEDSERALQFMQAIKILKSQPHQAQSNFTQDVDPNVVSSLILQHTAAIERLEKKEKQLKEEIARIQPLGEFDLEEMRAIEKETGRCIQFFCIKKENVKAFNRQDALISMDASVSLGVSNDMEYYMTFSKQAQSASQMMEIRLTQSLKELHADLETVKKEIKTCREELEKHASYINFLKQHLIQAINESHLTQAKEGKTSHLEEALFAIEAWVPQNQLHALFSLLEGIAIHAEEVAMTKQEQVPTYLQNQNYGKLGEDLIQIYDIPAHQDKDPSTWVFWAFAVFFAMIIADAGYGVLFLIAALTLRKIYPHVEARKKRFLKLFTLLSAFCIGWGVLSGSYFGLQLSPKHPLNRMNVIQAICIQKANYHLKHRDETYSDILRPFPELAKATSGKELLFQAKIEKNGVTKHVVADDFQDSILMEIALITGVIHITFSLLRQLPRSLTGIGWIFAMVGAYLFFPKILKTTSIVHFTLCIPKETGYQWGQQLFWGGLSFACLASFIQNKWKGLLELLKPIELFADVLSYIRLYALGLAAMVLSQTFNELGMKFGYVLGFFIVFIGHALNMSIGIMGGTIHGLRLNFIEWYHHSFEGGGKLFNPLKLIKSKGE